MDDIPWLYVAMIFIAFASWVWNKVQEAAAIRRQRLAERRAAERSRRTTEPEWESPYRPQPQPVPEPEPEPPQSFRDVFRELERQFSEPEEEEFPSRTPPPLPEQPSLPEPEPEWSPEAVPLRSVTRPRRRKKTRDGARGRETSQVLAETLRDRGRLRNALILNEILAKPKALQR